jgi:hypothetical protein
MYRIVLYMLTERDKKLIIAKVETLAEVRRVMNHLATGTMWSRNRRPDIHTFGDLVLTYERDPDK